MKQFWLSLTGLALVACFVHAADEALPGLPVKMEAENGKVVNAYVLSTEEGGIKVQFHGSDKTMTIPAEKIRSFEFISDYDAEAIEQQFIAGEYGAVCKTLGDLLKPYADYMVVNNNFTEAYTILLKANYLKGDYAEARKVAKILESVTDPEVAQQIEVYRMLADLREGKTASAEKWIAESEDEAAKLYLEASLLKAQDQPSEAMKKLMQLIIKHGNNMDWLPAGEYLCAELYYDLAQVKTNLTDSLMESAISTADQVEKMYNGTHVSADAAALREELEKKVTKSE